MLTLSIAGTLRHFLGIRDPEARAGVELTLQSVMRCCALSLLSSALDLALTSLNGSFCCICSYCHRICVFFMYADSILSFVVAFNLKIYWVHTHLPLAVCFNLGFQVSVDFQSTLRYFSAIRFVYAAPSYWSISLRPGGLVLVHRPLCWRSCALFESSYSLWCSLVWPFIVNKRHRIRHTYTHTHICVA